MPPNNAPGIDKTPIRVIKDCLNPIVHAFRSIVNASFLTRVFPSKWKTAEITPIPKDGDHEQANNNFHFYQFYLRFAKGLYIINSYRICTEMTLQAL